MNDLAEQHELELNISRLVDVPAESLYRCWTEPDLVVRWFTPAPWVTLDCNIDLRVGGRFDTLLKGPDRPEFWHRGVYLEIIPNRKILFTDALLPGWQPSTKAFAVVTVTFDREHDKTRYTGRVAHWTREDRDNHQTSFYDGWSRALDQLVDVAKTL